MKKALVVTICLLLALTICWGLAACNLIPALNLGTNNGNGTPDDGGDKPAVVDGGQSGDGETPSGDEGESHDTPAHTHSYGDWVVADAATCTEDGLRYRICATCGDVERETLSATGHQGQWTVTAEPTCTLEGSRTINCTACGQTITESIAATGHDNGEWITTKASSCGCGERAKTCSVCGNMITEAIVPDVTKQHVYDQYGICTVCGEHRASEGLRYTINDNVATVTGYTGTDAIVYIPSVYAGAVVRQIDQNAFPSTTTELMVPNCIVLYTSYYPFTRIYCQGNPDRERLRSMGASADIVYNYAPAHPTLAGQYWHYEDGEIVPYAGGDHTYESDLTCIDRECTICGYTSVATTEHAYDEGICPCGAIDLDTILAHKAYYRHNDYIYFGTYPQSEVTDTSLTTALNTTAGELPTAENAQGWTPYEYYYINGSVSEYMWYIDLTTNGEKYRGVYFTSYRPSARVESSSPDTSFQYDNGYNTGTVYWFRYEPIKWRILSESEGEALLLAEMVLDSQDYDIANTDTYAYSAIRAWLNGTFYKTAFTSYQKQLILLTTVDNSVRSANPTGGNLWDGGNNQYAFQDTEDHVFLLSMQEATDSAYGFNGSRIDPDPARCKQNTDYARCQGAWSDSDNGCWWLRSPYSACLEIGYIFSVYGDGADITFFALNIGVVPALRIRLTSGVAYTRIDAEGQETDDGDYLLFGTYPQSEVTDADLITTLNTAAGGLPTAEEALGWTSYGYYANGSTDPDYMWYVDLAFGDATYRGVYFTAYRPEYTTSIGTEGTSAQDNNGFGTGTVYWYRYDPIKWRILSESNGTALIFCEVALDSQEYCHSTAVGQYAHNGGTGFANNYALSTIRRWLNDTFYNTAFNDLQKELILLTTVDNSARSTNPDAKATQWEGGVNNYACEDTEDRVFLLSEREVTIADYGFDSSYGIYDTARRKRSTDYAKSQGVAARTDDELYGLNVWWLRSPSAAGGGSAFCVSPNGRAGNASATRSTDIGVVPALTIRLS